jgi:hypothetical protein
MFMLMRWMLKPFSSIRKEEVMLTLLQISYARLTHGHLLRGDLAPICILCGMPLPFYTSCGSGHIVTWNARCSIFMVGKLCTILEVDLHNGSNVVAFLCGMRVDRYI